MEFEARRSGLPLRAGGLGRRIQTGWPQIFLFPSHHYSETGPQILAHSVGNAAMAPSACLKILFPTRMVLFKREEIKRLTLQKEPYRKIIENF